MENDSSIGRRKIAAEIEELKSGLQVVVPGKNDVVTEAIWAPVDGVDVENVEWLWDQRIPFALTIFLGDPDTGKSLATIDAAARVSTGRDFPDAKNGNPPSRVLLMVAEDSIANTVKPRLIAAGADTSRIEYLKRVEIRQGARKAEREFALDEDLKHLEQKIEASPDIRLVICDTVSSYLLKTEMGKEQPMRKVLLPIRDLCEKRRVAFIGVAHFNKRSDVSMIHKASGAVALVGVPRAAWVFGANKDVPGDFFMLRIKNNLSKLRTGLSYTIAEKEIRKVHGSPVIAPYIVWRDQVVDGEANDLLAPESADERKQSKAAKFLLEFLAKGPCTAISIIQEAAVHGIHRTNLFAGKKEAGIFAYKSREGWWWSLEPKAGLPNR